MEKRNFVFIDLIYLTLCVAQKVRRQTTRYSSNSGYTLLGRLSGYETDQSRRE